MKTYKGYILRNVPVSPTLIYIAVEGRGGKIPKVLEGYFTSYGVAEGLINSYLANQPEASSEVVTDERKARSKS